MERLTNAYNEYSKFTQAEVDAIVEAATNHFITKAEELGLMAHEETGMGRPAHKTAKNLFATDYVRRWYKDVKTCGVVKVDEENDVEYVASPMGVIAAVIPTTNPTSTVAFKALCTLKTRNAMIVAPHPRAKKSTFEALRIIIEGAVAAGAPKDIAACISEPSITLTDTLMKHPKTALILATGGPGMVKAAYSSGHPAVGVGPGNVPVVVDEFANLQEVALNVVASKNFDYGVICSSEQVVIAHETIYDKLKDEFLKQGAHFLSTEEAVKVSQLLFKDGGALNADVVGQSPTKIATMAGITVDPSAALLVGEFDCIKTSAFAREKLSPVLGFTKRSNIDEMFQGAVDVLKLGGEGHTASYYTNKATQLGRINRFANTVIVTRCLINQPTAPGGIGGVYNFGMAPSMTLGCGSYGGNYVSDNVGPLHLVNMKKVTRCADDHAIVMRNIDCLVPPHISNRCAMELLILSFVLLAKDGKILHPHPEIKEVVKISIDFISGVAPVSDLRRAIQYFEDCDLYERGHNDINLKSVCIEFNLPGGNLYPIMFPKVASKLEHCNWENLSTLDCGVNSLEQAVDLIVSLRNKTGMLSDVTPSSKDRISRCGGSILAEIL